MSEHLPEVLWPEDTGPMLRSDFELTPDGAVANVKARLKLIDKLMRSILKKDVDYGLVPNTKKNTLFKAGAEKIALAFGLTAVTEQKNTFLETGHLVCLSQVRLYKDGSQVSLGVGMCSSMESKYSRRYVDEETDIPVPKAYWDARDELVLRDATKVYDKSIKLGTYKNGTFFIKKRIIQENQVAADNFNTVMKMSKKRAFVDAVITFSGVSSLFTQDMEDFSGNGGDF